MKIKSIPSVILYEFNQQIKGLNTEYQHYIKNVLNHAGNRGNFGENRLIIKTEVASSKNSAFNSS